MLRLSIRSQEYSHEIQDCKTVCHKEEYSAYHRKGRVIESKWLAERERERERGVAVY